MAKHYAVIEIEIDVDSNERMDAVYKAEQFTQALITLFREEISQVTLGKTVEDAHASLGYVRKEG